MTAGRSASATCARSRAGRTLRNACRSALHEAARSCAGESGSPGNALRNSTVTRREIRDQVRSQPRRPLGELAPVRAVEIDGRSWSKTPLVPSSTLIISSGSMPAASGIGEHGPGRETDVHVELADAAPHQVVVERLEPPTLKAPPETAPPASTSATFGLDLELLRVLLRISVRPKLDLPRCSASGTGERGECSLVCILPQPLFYKSLIWIGMVRKPVFPVRFYPSTSASLRSFRAILAATRRYRPGRRRGSTPLEESAGCDKLACPARERSRARCPRPVPC